ncbi:MAG: cation diffusion facilitator family transporter [bacterium]
MNRKSSIGDRERKIIQVSRVSILGNAVLSVLKISVGLYAGSLAVVADGIDSASDILTSLITLFTAHIVGRPPDKKYPYGYAKADTVATKALAFIIFFAGAQLAMNSANRLLFPVEEVMPDQVAIWVVILSIIIKFLLAFYMRKTGKAVSSAMLIANARNMLNDVIISFSVLTGLVLTFIFNMPVIDKLAALAVSIYIMVVAFRIFMQTNREMMDGIDDEEIYRKIISSVNAVEGAYNPHRIRVRKLAHYYLIALDIEVDGKLKLEEAHKIGVRVEESLKENIRNIYDILVHVEPRGNIEPDEAYGISEENL